MNYAMNFSAINLLMHSNAGQTVLTSVRASPEPLTHNEAMTLRELLGHISSTAGMRWRWTHPSMSSMRP